MTTNQSSSPFKPHRNLLIAGGIGLVAILFSHFSYSQTQTEWKEAIILQNHHRDNQWDHLSASEREHAIRKREQVRRRYLKKTPSDSPDSQ